MERRGESKQATNPSPKPKAGGTSPQKIWIDVYDLDGFIGCTGSLG